MTDLNFSSSRTKIDTTDSKQMLEAFEHLQSLRSIPSRVHYIYDLTRRQTIYGRGSVPDLLGYSAIEIHELGPHGLAKLVHPDDLHRVAKHYENLETLCYGDVITIQYRMRRSDGSWCELYSQETLLMPQTIGKAPSQILGMVEDRTQPTITR